MLSDVEMDYSYSPGNRTQQDIGLHLLHFNWLTEFAGFLLFFPTLILE